MVRMRDMLTTQRHLYSLGEMLEFLSIGRFSSPILADFFWPPVY
jgi:hypothetical protein